MTEEEYLASANPDMMLLLLRNLNTLSPRKGTLFGCACLRMTGLVDGPDTERELAVLEEGAESGSTASTRWWISEIVNAAQRDLITFRGIVLKVRQGAERAGIFHAIPSQEQMADDQVCLLRAHFGNPYRPLVRRLLPSKDFLMPIVLAEGDLHDPVIAPAFWFDGVKPLATAVYQDRGPDGHLDPTGLCAMADALEENGCEHCLLLDSLREPGPKFRGHWVLDLALEKT